MTTKTSTLLELTLIDVPKRLRSVKKAGVEALMDSFLALGQLQPIIVREHGPRYTLIAGAHRLEAARKLGWTEIGYRQVTPKGDEKLDRLSDELIEIDENSVRVPLTPLEYSKHVNVWRDTLVKKAARLRLLEAEKAQREAKTAEEKNRAKVAKHAAKVALSGQVSGTNITFKHDQPTSRKGKTAHRETIGKEHGIVPRQARRILRRYPTAKKICNEAGVDVENLVETTLDQAAQLDALDKLNTANPAAAQRCVKAAIKYKNTDIKTLATKTLSQLESRLKEEERHEREKKKEGRYVTYAERILAAAKALRQAVELATKWRDHEVMDDLLPCLKGGSAVGLEKLHVGYAAKAAGRTNTRSLGDAKPSGQNLSAKPNQPTSRAGGEEHRKLVQKERGFRKVHAVH